LPETRRPGGTNSAADAEMTVCAFIEVFPGACWLGRCADAVRRA